MAVEVGEGDMVDDAAIVGDMTRTTAVAVDGIEVGAVQPATTTSANSIRHGQL